MPTDEIGSECQEWMAGIVIQDEELPETEGSIFLECRGGETEYLTSDEAIRRSAAVCGVISVDHPNEDFRGMDVGDALVEYAKMLSQAKRGRRA